MVNVVHKPIDDEQAETHTSNFWTLPIEYKCCTMVEWSQFITFASSRVHWGRSLWINVFNRSSSNPEDLPEHGVSLMLKQSSLKRENNFLAELSPISLSPYMVQMFLASPLLLPLYWTQREEYVRIVPISPLGTPFSSVHRSTHYLQMTNLQYVNSSTIIEMQIKSDNRQINP